MKLLFKNKKDILSIFLTILMVFCTYISGYAEITVEDTVRVIYFLPNDREPHPDIDGKLNDLIKNVQQRQAEQMEAHGFGRKSFRLEVDNAGKAVVHHVVGRLTDAHYSNEPWDVWDEIGEQFDLSRNYYFTVLGVRNSSITGFGASGGAFNGRALISGPGGSGFSIDVAAHELEHAFGLHHFYSGAAISDENWMCYWRALDVHRAFNPIKNVADASATIGMLSPIAGNLPSFIRLRFAVTDANGIHQIQLLAGNLIDWGLVDCKKLEGQSESTVEFVTTLPARTNSVSVEVIDIHGFRKLQTFDIDITPLLPPPKIVSIPDENLAAAVRREIGDSITTHTVLNLVKLNVSNSNITKLTGLEHAHNLLRLQLGGEWIAGTGFVNSNSISDFSPIKGLKHLGWLELFNNNITDVSFLAEMTQLGWLDIFNNNITDISPLAELKQLRSLGISNNNIIDVSPLARLDRRLDTLVIARNNIRDITAIGNLTNLRRLYLQSNEITDISPLVNLINLEVLSVAGNPIEDLSPLRTLLANNPDLIIDIEVPPPPTTLTFSPNTIADQTFTVGTSVSLTLPIATGGTAPYTYALSRLPPGLAFTLGTRLLSGTPTTATPTIRVTYTATDATSTSASLTFTITVRDKLAFNPNVIADQAFTVGEAVNLTLPVATGGTPPYTYTLAPLPEGLSFDKTRRELSGTPTTVETTSATYTATDAANVSASLTFTIEVTEGVILDVNGDGQVTVVDLAIVALFYGVHVPTGISLPADVNVDGIVDMADLIAVTQGIDAAGGVNKFSQQDVELALLIAAEQAVVLEAVAGAPVRVWTIKYPLSRSFASKNVEDALFAARADVRFQKGVRMLADLLDLLIEVTAIPEATALLPNYPNPFNPETWLPYQLATSASVTLSIYSVDGRLVRTLDVGHQPAGVYRSKYRAAYWDGRNDEGEPVSSGLYFYTLRTGNFAATRKLIIRK